MKRFTNSQFLIPCFLLLLFILPTFLHAQPGFGGGDDVLDVPVDGGLSLLVAAGIGYGAKKLKEKRMGEQFRLRK